MARTRRRRSSPERRLLGDPFVYGPGFAADDEGKPTWSRLVEVEYDLALAMVKTILDEVEHATVRQVYYVGSRRGWWEKDYRTDDGIEKRNSYQRVSGWLTEMRLRGDIEYGSVLESGRRISEPLRFATPREYAEHVRHGFRLKNWLYQPNHVEVWVEGEAIVPIVDDALEGLDVPLMPNRGNTSTTSIRRSCRRLLSRAFTHMEVHFPGLQHEDGSFVLGDMPDGLIHVLYCGDHDASGWFMDQDIRERLRKHGERFHTGDLVDCDKVQFRRIALTLDQVVEYDLEPDAKPAGKKGTGKLYREHFADHPLVQGDRQWSFEALSPPVAKKIIRDEVEALMDHDAWKRAEALDEAIGKRLLREDGTQWLADLLK